ncbi:GNAT family N-acetyltransferase [Ferrimonas balearica]|uniref:GNAT family N-acetyltransferase n=1 Tax=Ferrimonas balearica TaxID=44012 RepID=UPI001C99F4D2|nr:GNAT family N-acetyltransferase [Ferrimonas balearica]MBY5991764.1 hypothetical protein [Ferrimonas balearica]
MGFSEPEVVAVTPQWLPVYQNLAQAYESEFSRLTRKKPDREGRFCRGTELGETVEGFLLYQDGIPCGLASVVDHGDQHEVRDLYIIPACRHGHLGRHLVQSLLDRHPGIWISRPMESAQDLVKFWQRVLEDYTHGHFEQQRMSDPQYGAVIQFRFWR